MTVNDVFYPLLNNQSRYLVLMGGAGSGKSYFAAQKCLIRLISEPDMRIIFCRKINKTIRNSQFLLFKDIIRKHRLLPYFDIAESRMDITYLPNGNQLLSASLDDPEKLKSLAQPTAIWIEEATELNVSDFRQLDLRLRAIHHTYVQICLSFNPISKKHWLYELFGKQQKPNTTLLKTTFLDNPHIDAAYADMMTQLATEDEHYHRIYALGLWGEQRKGLIYHYTTATTLPDNCELIYGLDFGYNKPTALVKMGLKEKQVFVEEKLYATGLTNSDLITRLHQLIPHKSSPIYADSAEPQRIAEIHRAGFNIKPAHKEVLPGIDFVKRHHLLVLHPCPNLIHELDHYRWCEDLSGNTLDQPVKDNDHALDALRYALYTHKGKPGLKIWGFEG